MTSPGAVRFGSTRPSRDGPWLLKSEIWSSAALGSTRMVSFTSVHCVLLTCEPTHSRRRAVAGMPIVLLSSPGRNQDGTPGKLGGKKNDPVTCHMSKVPDPNV